MSAGALACATQLVYASVDQLAIALIVTVLGGAGLVACEVIAETVLARVIPRGTLGRVAGLFHAMSVAAMVGGAVLASILIDATSLKGSLWLLGSGALIVAVSCRLGLRGLDAASQRRADALASRLVIIEQLPVTVGVPQLVLEQLASASELCPLPSGVDIVVQGAPAHAFYAVVDGRVVVRRDGVVRVHLGPGDSFGERGLLDNAPRNATVTTEGPRIVEVNARMGGGRIHQIVEAVWGVDLIEADVRSSLGLPQAVAPCRKPRCAVVNALVHAPARGRLVALPFGRVSPEGALGVEIDVQAAIGEDVRGPEEIFSTALAEVTVSGKNLRRARSVAAEVLRDPPIVVPLDAAT